MMANSNTGTHDATYNLVAVLYHALKGADNCETYQQDASDEDVKSFFREAQDKQRELAEQAKQLLSQQLG